MSGARALQYALYVRLYLHVSRGDGSGRRLLIGSRSGCGDSRDGFGGSDGVFIDVGGERGQHIGGQQRRGFGRSGLRCVARYPASALPDDVIGSCAARFAASGKCVVCVGVRESARLAAARAVRKRRQRRAHAPCPARRAAARRRARRVRAAH